jgi:hypothetical protein
MTVYLRCFFVLVVLTSVLTAASAPLRVDLNIPGRSDVSDPHFEAWTVNSAMSISKTFSGVTVTFTKIGGSDMVGKYYKPGLDYDALMATDGLIGEKGGMVRMTISGLSNGNHTFVTYHNTLDNPDTNTFSKLNIALNGQPHVTGFAPTNRVLNNYDAGFIFYEVTVAGGSVIIEFDGDGSGSNDNVVINGFEIDTSDPAKKATKPVPSNGDGHADADDGGLELSWTPAANAVSHDVYFGTDFTAVDGADSMDAEFKGNQSTVGFIVNNLTNLIDYYWRVDEVDSSGVRTKGQTWRFRKRHLAFPTAQGWGRFAIGGRGGTVYHVTNLNNSGAGSLRDGIEAEGPRTIVFDVSGMIDLDSRLILRNPYCTVAGQTAPGKGICIKDYDFGPLGGNDFIIRHVRVRVGKEIGTDKTLGGMGMGSTDHSIIDHCSISWSIDEAFSSRSAGNITLQRTLISEALCVAGHKNYPSGKSHGYAASIGGDVASFHHNLLAHCEGRNWSLAGALSAANVHTGRLDIRNNVVYNWDGRTTDGGAKEVNFVRNYYKPGPATVGPFTELNPQFEAPGFGPQQYYVEGNIMEGHHGPEGPLPPFDGVDPRGTQPRPVTLPVPFFEHYVTTQSAAEAYDDVLADVGCNRPMLDEHDTRVINEVRNGTFTYRGYVTNRPGLIDNQADVGGWENYPEVHRPANWDTDQDGMPNDWENKRAYLNPNNPADRNEDYNNDGYTNLEDYLNYLAGDQSVPDDTPPTPNPMTWAEAPHSVGGANIKMKAITATDICGVQYYFANHTDPSHDSGWISSPSWMDTALDLGTTYSYAVKARDTSINSNETDWSKMASAATDLWTCTALIESDFKGECKLNLEVLESCAADWLLCNLNPDTECWQ